MAYATRSDLYKYGLPRGMLANPGRLCATVLASTDAFELDGHGFENGDAIVFRAECGGVVPPPIVALATYFAIRRNEQTFQVSDVPLPWPLPPAPIDLTSDGVSVVVATPLPMDDVLEFYSRFADGFLPAHLVPLDPERPYPITVTALVAELAAKKLMLMAGQASASMTEMELSAKAQLERWARGLPLRDARATAPANLSCSANVDDTRGRNWYGPNWWGMPGRIDRGVGGGGYLP